MCVRVLGDAVRTWADGQAGIAVTQDGGDDTKIPITPPPSSAAHCPFGNPRHPETITVGGREKRGVWDTMENADYVQESR